jgi:enoyl-CoA hydratase/carnithine racemase
MNNLFRSAAAALALSVLGGVAHAANPAYFTDYPGLRMSRDHGVLVVEMTSAGGPLKFSAKEHETYPDAFYDISRDRENKVVILTGAGGEWMPDIDFASFGNVADPDVWAKVHDEGDQILDNIANIRVPVICAVEGKAWVHTEYCLLANVIVAGKSATFNDLPHFKAGIVPGDGVFTLWSYYIGPGRAQAMLLNPEPVSAATAHDWGVVAEVTPDGQALARARAIADTLRAKPEVTLRYTRAHFTQPIKQRLVTEIGNGLGLEGASAAALVKQMQAKSK